MTSTEVQSLEQALSHSEEHLWQLHVRAAKGESLTDAEQRLLADWYSAQEQKERAALQLPTNVDQVTSLQMQVETLLTQIATATARIKQLTDENKVLRQDIAQLQRRLAQQTPLQTA